MVLPGWDEVRVGKVRGGKMATEAVIVHRMMALPSLPRIQGYTSSFRR